jgi:hypothetical protein
MSAREVLGRALGGILAPLAAEGSLARGTAVVHSDGVIYRCEVSALGTKGPLGELARALAGPALVRFSNSMHRFRRGHDPHDILGAAVRFGVETTAPQDLLFGTFRRLWLLPLGVLLTDPRDFLANDYHAVLPFRVPGVKAPLTFRLAPQRHEADGRDRKERLEHAVASGQAVLRLDALERGVGFTEIATITLREPAPIEQGSLCWNPFRDGAGIVPVGLLQAVRAAVYPASQAGRAAAHGPSDQASSQLRKAR